MTGRSREEQPDSSPVLKWLKEIVDSLAIGIGVKQHTNQSFRSTGGKLSLLLVFAMLACGVCASMALADSACDVFAEDTVALSTADLKDKIKGAWAAQTIGVTFGSPVEFKYNSTLIPDDKKIETLKLPTTFRARKFYPCWRYQMPMGKHKVRLRVLNPTNSATLELDYAIIYSNKPDEKGSWQ